MTPTEAAHRKWRSRAALVSVAACLAGLLLPGCGGGGGSSSPPPPPAPPEPPPPANRAPVADAGDDFTETIQTTPVTLDGTGSSDPDNDESRFSWVILRQPESSDTQIENGSSAQPSFVASVPGEYGFELQVSDPAGLSSTDSVTATLTNEAPVVEIATTERNVIVGAEFRLDARGTTDADGHELSFSWRVTALPEESNIPTAFDGPLHRVSLDTQGTYVFELEVDDGYESASATLAIDATVYTVFPLSHAITDAEYDPTGERIIALASDRLVTIRPDGSQVSVALPTRGKAVSVSPDGAFAAVGHDGWVSHVDLDAMLVLATHGVPANLGDVVIDGDGFAHGFPDTGQWVAIHSVDLASGALRRTHEGFIRDRTRARLHPSGTKIYGADNGLAPSDIERYSIMDGAVSYDYDSPYHGDFAFCGKIWYDPLGKVILSPCGVVVYATQDHANDMSFAMRLENLGGRIRHAASSAFDGLWYVAEQDGNRGSNRIRTFSIQHGTQVESLSLPWADTSGERRWRASFVFASADTGTHYVVADDDSDGMQRQALLVRQTPEVSAFNLPPTAVVARFSTARVSQEIVLDGSASSDPEGVPLTYRWTLVSAPDETVLSEDALQRSVVRFTATTAGVYDFELRVDDGQRSSSIAHSTVTVFEADSSLVHRLEHIVADVEYSAALHAIVYLTADSHDMYILDLTDLTRRRVPLDRQPRRVGLSPDGRMAAASHSGLVSLVDLRTAAVVDSQDVPTEWGDIVLDRHRRAHLVPYRGQWVAFHSEDFAIDRAVGVGIIYAGAQLRMHPREDWVYAADVGLSPSDFEKFDVGELPPESLGDSPYHGDFHISGNLWISEDGDRLLTAGGSTFHSSSDPGLDMTYSGALPDGKRVMWADHSTETDEWAVIVAAEYGSLPRKLAFYTDDFFNEVSVVDLEGIPVPDGVAATSGSHVFQSEDGSSFVVLLKADGLFHQFAVQITDR